MYQLNLKEDSLEIIPYPVPQISVRAYRGPLYDYPDHQVPPHWHDELEFVLVEKGTALYRANGRAYALEAGDGLFVNYNRMHSGASPTGEDYLYSVLQIRPSLLAENLYVMEKYVTPLISFESLDALALSPAVDWQRELLDQVRRLIELNLDRGNYYELETLSGAYHILQPLHQHMVFREIVRNSDSPNATAMMSMMNYIHQHYAERVTLQQIAGAGAMCQSKCCTLFQNAIQQTPISYLQSYRIQKSFSLLTSSRMSITEIAGVCGFNGASYFIEVFRRHTGMTPREFQKEFSAPAAQGLAPQRQASPAGENPAGPRMPSPSPICPPSRR